MEAGVKRPVAVGIGVAVVVAIGLLVVWGFTPRETSSVPSGLTEVNDPAEARKIVELHRLHILTSTNYIGQKVYLVRTTLKNISSKPVRVVDLKMTFLDYDKKFVKDEVRNAFSAKQRPLDPGTEYVAEMAFENPPKTWNYHVPDTTVAKLAY